MNLLTANNLQFITSQGRILFSDINLSISDKDRIGLVGKNGIGKSTLMQILAKKLEPTLGSVTHTENVYYLPQIDLKNYRSSKNVFTYLNEQIEDWWKVINLIKEIFETEIDPQNSLSSLSGGELIKLNLALGLARSPKLLLLDEPTNHLDLKSYNKLINYLESFGGAYVVVSHNPHFLDKVVTQIWEFDNGQIISYGGNYSFYKNQKAVELDAKKLDFQAAKKEISKFKAALQRENLRMNRNQNKQKLRTIKGDRSIPRMAKNTLRNAAQISSSKRNNNINDKMAKAVAKSEKLKSIATKKVYVTLSSSNVKQNKHLLTLDHEDIYLNNIKLIEDVNLDISFGNRIVITGNNGSGKTTLAKFILSKSVQDLKIVYIDQKYEIVDPNLTILENIQKSNPTLSFTAIREQLSKFLFPKFEDTQKIANTLSGGEVARLTFALATNQNADLLILDEPTNNLDIETIDVITEALNNFEGAIVVISHNIDFLKRININSAYQIKSGKFIRLNTLPDEENEFYNALV